MNNIKGKYNTATVFTDSMEESAEAQIRELCDQAFSKESKIRIMPDVHAGAGCTIGTTMTITDKIVPNLVGVDIGCGMFVCKMNRVVYLGLEKFDEYIQENIPSGFNVHEKEKAVCKDIYNLRCYEYLKNKDSRFERAIGSLGGGNHFIEIDKDDTDNFYLVIHSGSRNLGNQVAQYYQDKAYEYHQGKKELIIETIDRLKKENKESEIQSAIQKIKNTETSKIPKALCYLEGDLFDDYIHDMDIIQYYAYANRNMIYRTILDYFGADDKETQTLKDDFDTFEVIHNYIDIENMILRKGAISAQKGERVLIPINMRDGCILAKGKGNLDWNYSAPHGAGRIMSRKQAREEITLIDFKASMEGIYSNSIVSETIDEAPMAYKSIDEILNNINDTVEDIEIIKPIYNFKAK